MRLTFLCIETVNVFLSIICLCLFLFHFLHSSSPPSASFPFSSFLSLSLFPSLSCDKSIEASMKTQSDVVNEIQEREASCETAKDGKETMQHQLQETEKSKQMVAI